MKNANPTLRTVFSDNTTYIKPMGKVRTGDKTPASSPFSELTFNWGSTYKDAKAYHV